MNKDKALLPSADNLTYDWVERDDPRITEVRLLREESTHGEVSGTPADNLIIHGESYDALHSLVHQPEFAEQYRGRVKLIYIDPPFNTKRTFEHYADGLEHSIWLGLMRERLLLFKHLLRPDGSIWVHLDSAEVHRCRALMDEVFGASNYLSTVTWRRTSAKSLAKRTMGTMHEDILIYGASEDAELKPQFTPLDPAYAKRFSQVDERGPYDTGDLTAGSHRPHLESGQPWKGFNPSDRKRCWAVPGGPLADIGIPPETARSMGMLEKLDALDAAGYISWPEKKDGFPRYKKYLDRAKGVALGDLWTDINVINSQAAERTGFSTQKPEALLERVLALGSDPGDIVLDCFGGSGTTAAVAHKMGRRWVTVELSEATIKEFIQPRLSRVVDGTDLGGITLKTREIPAGPLPEGVSLEDIRTTKRTIQKMVLGSDAKSPPLDGLEIARQQLLKEIDRLSKTSKIEDRAWNGGGGFRYLTVQPSAYFIEAGRLFLADGVDGDLFEAYACAQLGFTVERNGTLVGVRGRERLGVVDGVVDDETARHYISQLSDEETLTIVGRGFTPDVPSTVRSLRPGSRVLKAPTDLARKSKVIR